MSRKKILIITGCGRAGTTYSTHALRELGLKIGHERLRGDGISSWYLASSKESVPLGPSLHDLRSLSKVVVHQVREPLSAISSIQVMGTPSWRLLADELPIDLHNDTRLILSMKYYYYWNRKAESVSDYRVRVEHFEDDVRPILASLNQGYDIRKSRPTQNDKINSREHGFVTWTDLEFANTSLCRKIQKMSQMYGY